MNQGKSYIYNPFDNLPLNTDRLYAMAKSQCGCEIYVPVRRHADPNVTKRRLQYWLDMNTTPNQPEAA